MAPAAFPGARRRARADRLALLVALWSGLARADGTPATPPAPAAPSAPACVACEVDVERVRRGYSSDEWSALLAGDVRTATAADGEADAAEARNVQATAILPYPPALVWSTLVDFPARPSFQPGAKDVRVVRADGDRVWVAEHLRFFLVDVRYTVINMLDPVRGTLRFEMDDAAPHDIGGTRGAWGLAPVMDGQRTLVTYRAWVDTGRHLPAMIERFLLRRSLPDLLSGLRDEVARRGASSR